MEGSTCSANWRCVSFYWGIGELQEKFRTRPDACRVVLPAFSKVVLYSFIDRLNFEDCKVGAKLGAQQQALFKDVVYTCTE